MSRLEGKVAVVTGSGRGIGRAIALCFAREGADIVVNDVAASNMKATADGVRALGRKVIAVEADVSRKEQVARLATAALDAFKHVDILVNNAGITRHAPLLEMSETDWDAVLDTDLKGVFLCTQAIAPQMVKQRYGKIINIASIVALGGGEAYMANYSAAKAGVASLTKTAARALSPHGITVNAIAPGMIVTELTGTRRTTEELEAFLEQRRSISLLGRNGTPEDVANLALFLASEESSFITAEIITCDGGRPTKL